MAAPEQLDEVKPAAAAHGRRRILVLAILLASDRCGSVVTPPTCVPRQPPARDFVTCHLGTWPLGVSSGRDLLNALPGERAPCRVLASLGCVPRGLLVGQQRGVLVIAGELSSRQALAKPCTATTIW